MSNPIRILPHADSDLPIPPVAVIRARCVELRSDAERMQDTPTVSQLTNLLIALDGGMRMAWVLGDLLVTSASTPGVVYTVSCGECSCPARKPCKHLRLAEVLLELLDVAAGDADMEADIDEWEFTAAMADYDTSDAVTPWYARTTLTAARAACGW